MEGHKPRERDAVDEFIWGVLKDVDNFEKCSMAQTVPTINFKSILDRDQEMKHKLDLERKTTLPAKNVHKKESINSYKWPKKEEVLAAQIRFFKHAPGASVWTQFVREGIRIEVEDCSETNKSCWVAIVEKRVGYFCRLHYVGCPTVKTDFWVNMCSPRVHPIGWSAAHGIALMPPKNFVQLLSSKQWQMCLTNALSGTTTLPWWFHTELESKSRFRPGQLVELVDKNNLAVVKLAEIYLISAQRLNISYYDNDLKDSGFVCHEDSELLHPVGWAESVGHKISAPPDYSSQWQSRSDKNCAPSELFKVPPHMDLSLEKGMKLEAIDPLDLSTISVATIKKVLKQNYVMIGLDVYDSGNKESDWFCCHVTSKLLFPVGFCAGNKLKLVTPKGIKNFNWPEYLEKTNSRAAPIPLPEIPKHGFIAGLQLEVVDLMSPSRIHVGTVARVIGRLLRVRFDEWSSEYDQYMDCESPDIYPVGWCDAFKHKLTGPPSAHISTSGGEIVNITMPKKFVNVNTKEQKESRMTNTARKSAYFSASSNEGDDSLLSVEDFSHSIQRECSPSRTLKESHVLCDPPQLSPNSPIRLRTPRSQSTASTPQSNKEDESSSPPKLSPNSPITLRTPRTQSTASTPQSKKEDESPSPSKLSPMSSNSPILLRAPRIQIWDIMASIPQNKKVSKSSPPKLSPITHKSPTTSRASMEQISESTESEKTVDKPLSKPSLKRSREDFWYEEEHPEVLPSVTRSGKLIKYASGLFVRKESVYNRILKKASKQKSGVNTSKANLKKKVPRRKTSSDSVVKTTETAAVPRFENPRTVFNLLQFQGSKDHLIPRLIEETAAKELKGAKLEPSKWNVRDVAKFLKMNDAEQYSDSFSQRKIDGPTFLNLTLNSLVHLTDSKVGPAMHIAELIKKLKCNTSKYGDVGS